MANSATIAAPLAGRRRGMRLDLRPVVRDGLVIAPAQLIDAHRDAIVALAAQTRLPNPFFLPMFLEPAIAAFGQGRVRLALLYDRGELVFFAPVVEPAISGPVFKAFRVWTHRFAPLGAPLMPRKRAREVAGLLTQALLDAGIRTFILPEAPLGVLEVAAIRNAIAGGGGGEILARAIDRPVLFADRCRDGATADAMITTLVSAGRRKEMGRQLRRLADVGPVRFATCEAPGEIDTALSAFLSLEASGWKGRAGSALASRSRLEEFARNAIGALAVEGHVRIDTLTAGTRLAAAMISLRCGGLAVPWKTTFSEALASHSPGSQIMLAATRAWLADPEVRRVDPVCGPDHPMLRHLWRGHRPVRDTGAWTGRYGDGTAAILCRGSPGRQVAPQRAKHAQTVARRWKQLSFGCSDRCPFATGPAPGRP